MQHSCHYKKLDLACDSYNLSFKKHESSSSLHVKTLFLWWKCVFQMLEYWAMQPGQYWTILQYMAILGNCVPDASVLLGKAGHTSDYLLTQFGFSHHLHRYYFPPVFDGLALGDAGWRNAKGSIFACPSPSRNESTRSVN